MTANTVPPPPQKIVHYPLSRELKGGRLIVLGNLSAKRIIFLHGGFPDDHSALLPLASSLATNNDCMVGVACMPGYDHPDPLHGPKPEGYSYEEMVAAMREGIQALVAQAKQENTKLACIFHDWGCLSGTIYVNRILQAKTVKSLTPDKLVLLDVCPPPPPDEAKNIVATPPSLYQVLCETTYRILFASCFALQRFVSRYVAAPVFVMGSAVVFNLLGLYPGSRHDARTLQERPPLPLSKLIYMMYPYWNLFTGMRMLRQEYVLPKNVPTLYMFGASKKCNFHSNQSVSYLEQVSNCRVVPVPEAGHWFYLQQPEVSLSTIQEFVFS